MLVPMSQNGTMATRTSRTKAPAPAAYHHGDLRNALVREGRRSLEENGVAELSLREVARRTGVSVAAPSRHFDGKEGLLSAIASDGFAELAAIRRAIADANPTALAKAREMMRGYVRFALQNRGLFNLMVGPRIIDAKKHAELQAATSESFNMFSDALFELAAQTGWPAKAMDLVAHAAWAMEHGLATLILSDRAPRHGRDVDTETMIDFSIELLLSGIAAGPAAFSRVASPAMARAPAGKSRKPVAKRAPAISR
jgi:AcrR family transcriptional regulator